MSTGWEERVQDEKNEYMMRRMSTRWEGWVQDEKDEYAGLEGWVQDEYRMREWAHDERMSTGWEGWVQDEKNDHWKKKKWKGRVQDELRMRRGSSIHAYPYAYPPSLTRDNAVSFNLFNYLSFTNCFALYWRSWSQENIIFYTIF